jgi:agmatine deiminase
VRFIPLPVDDSWCRDSGPTFICHPELGTAGISWRFNAWGGKSAHGLDESWRGASSTAWSWSASAASSQRRGAIHVDGEGTLITTESVLLNSNRNPGMTKVEIERIFSRLLGIEKTIWLPGDPDHVTGDMTDGHVDGVCAFAPATCWWMPPWTGTPPTAAWCGRTAEPWPWPPMREVAPSSCLELFEASEAVDAEAEVFCASYTNYIANGAIIMPGLRHRRRDEAAGRCWARLPGSEVVPVRINHWPTAAAAFTASPSSSRLAGASGSGLVRRLRASCIRDRQGRRNHAGERCRGACKIVVATTQFACSWERSAIWTAEAGTGRRRR